MVGKTEQSEIVPGHHSNHGNLLTNWAMEIPLEQSSLSFKPYVRGMYNYTRFNTKKELLMS